MKTLKVILIALVTVFTFGAAKAQVHINARIGARPARRVVVVHHRPYHHPYHRPHYRHHRY